MLLNCISANKAVRPLLLGRAIISQLYSARSVSTSSKMAGVKQLPDGIYPTMITPFLNDGSKSVDWKGLDCK